MQFSKREYFEQKEREEYEHMIVALETTSVPDSHVYTAAEKRALKEIMFDSRKNGHKDRVKCPGCFNYYLMKDLTFDRIDPGHNGGEYSRDNLQLLCFHCNSVKGSKNMDHLHRRLVELEIIEPTLLPQQEVP